MDDPSRYIMWKYLPYEDIVSLCQTSRGFSEICNDPETWRFLLYRDFNIQMIGNASELRDLYRLEKEKKQVYSDLMSHFNALMIPTNKIHLLAFEYVVSMYPGAMDELDRRRDKEHRKMIEEHNLEGKSLKEALRSIVATEPEGYYRNRIFNMTVDLLTEIIAKENLQDERIANTPSIRNKIVLISLKYLTPEEKQVLYDIKNGKKLTIDELYQRVGIRVEGYNTPIVRFIHLLVASRSREDRRNTLSLKPEVYLLL